MAQLLPQCVADNLLGPAAGARAHVTVHQGWQTEPTSYFVATMNNLRKGMSVVPSGRRG